MLLPSLRWTLLLLFLLVCIGQLSEGKRGGGGGRSSSSRGSSGARSSSKSSGRGFGGSKSSSKSSSSGKSWWSSKSSSSSDSDSGKKSWWGSGSTKLSSSRTGGGFTNSGSSPSYGWSSSNPRPSVTRDSVSRGLFSSSGASGYYGSSYGCGFGGCGHTYVVYHHYPRSYYYSQRTTTTTPAPIEPNADQVSSAVAGGVVTKNFSSNETIIHGSDSKGANDTIYFFDYDAVNSNDTSKMNSTEILEIVDAMRPLIVQDLAFFWDAKYLPSEDATGCVSYLPANSNSTISYCDVNEYSRCSRNLVELPGFLSENLFFKDGTAPSRLAWMCPAGTGCCDWECCHDGTGWGFVEIAFVTLLSCCVLYYVGRCALYCFSSCVEERELRKMNEERKLLRDNEA